MQTIRRHRPVILASIVPILIPVMFLLACPQTNRYQKAAQASKDFALADQGFQSAVIAAKAQNLITQDESNRLQNLAATLAKIDMHINDAIGKANTGQGVQADIDAALVEAQLVDVENLDWIKNPNAKATLQIALATARVGLRLIQTIIAK